MKRLTAIKLVNWHYFGNETQRLRGSTLLTGDNGSGKSTLLDAIQFALIGDARKVRFNVSAHDETRRTLDGYLRCKTGVEQGDGRTGYLRSGDFTTYIVLEFLDTRRRQPFLLGCGVDSYASGEHDPPLFFKLEDCALADDLFLNGNRPRSARREFRLLVQERKGATVYPSAEQYRADVLAKLGHLSPRFFTLLVRALAFQPITHIRQFVYDYVLDARELNIDAMRENLQQYRRFEQMLGQVKEKIAALQHIAGKFDEKRQVEDWIAVQDYLVLRARREQAAEERERLERERTGLLHGCAAAEREIQALTEQKLGLQRHLHDIAVALAADSAYLLAQKLADEIRQLEQTEQTLRRQAAALARQAQAEVDAVDGALAAIERDPDAVGLAEAAADLDALAGASHLFAPLIRGDLAAPVPAAELADLAAAADRVAEQVAQHRHGLKGEQAALGAEAERLRHELAELGERRLTYPAYVTELRRLIEEDTGARADVLCELLEIPDERWQNAVEGYLNTQRFDLIVAPAEFDAALAVYERRKQEFRLHSVGLVNTGAMPARAGGARPGSLGEEVRTDNPHARAYVARLLGRVMKCNSEQELKQHPVAITPTCMTYRNHTARQIPQDVYALWYVGARALVRQQELKAARLAEVKAGLEQIAAADRVAAEVWRALKDKETLYTRVLTPAWEQVAALPQRAAELAGKRRELGALDLTQVAGLKRQQEEVQGQIQECERQERELVGTTARNRERAGYLADRQAAWDRDWLALGEQLQAFADERPAIADQGAARYQEERRGRSNQAIADGFAANRATNVTRADNLRKELHQLRVDYNTHFQFGGPPFAEDNGAYAAELAKLVESELPAYEQQIAAARGAAEQEFKEHFIYRLQEYVNDAHQQFRNLNQVLKEIYFGQDRYRFQVSPSPSHREAYAMITDPLAVEGPSLFAGAFREKHQATLDQLFAAILTDDEQQQLKNIAELTDYRTYLDFDILIDHNTGETTRFSRVLREKSGGETQTPFYVAIVAAFLQLYRPGNQDSARLMLFDEAFNRMDPDRAENTLRFIRQLGMQVVAAAPTDKVQIIAPHVDTVLVVVRDGPQTWIMDGHQLLDDAAEAEAAATGETP